MSRINQKGSITLFAVIVIVPAVIIAMVLAHAGNRALSVAILEHRLRVSVMTVAASFNQKLLEDYGIYGVLEGEYGQAIEVQYGKSLGEKDSLCLAILAAGGNQAPLMAVKRVIGKLEAIFSYSGEALEIMDTASEQVGEIISKSISSVVGENLPEVNLKDIVTGVKNLASALGENWSYVDWTWAWNQEGQFNISGILSQARQYFLRVQNWKAGKEIEKSVAYTAYVMSYFSYYGSGVSREAVLPSSEVEYCVFGKVNGALNVVNSFSEIYKMRVAINFVDYLVTLEIPEPETLVICAAVLALIAATTDILTLMAGESLALSPHLDMVDTDYEDYIIMLLFFEPSSAVLARIGNVINMNLKAGEGKGLSCYYTSITATCDGKEYSYEYR